MKMLKVIESRGEIMSFESVLKDVNLSQKTKGAVDSSPWYVAEACHTREPIIIVLQRGSVKRPALSDDCRQRGWMQGFRIA